MLPCVQFEDDHLLVVDKPSGWNTHAASPWGGEGIYDWLRDREARWEGLALLHRLDKETSGLMVFGKSREANRGLSRQFEMREVTKRYRFLTDQEVDFTEREVRSAIVRAGDRYRLRPPHAGAPEAVSHFCRVEASGRWNVWEARPLTGLTHQVRVHAASVGLPILGDALYGGTTTGREVPGRLCLHAAQLGFHHPVSGQALNFESVPRFEGHGPWSLREAWVEPELTDAYRLVHGAGDGRPGMIMERWGPVLLWQREGVDGVVDYPRSELEWVCSLARRLGCRSVYGQALYRRLQGRAAEELSPGWLWGERVPETWSVRENGVGYETRFGEGYSVGLFLDQRENRRRILENRIAHGFPVRAGGLAGTAVFNGFAYTCGFSVCAARVGARTTSVDLSRKALEWGKANFRANGLDPEQHEFWQGDVFQELRRRVKRGCEYDAVFLDPPTFSRTKKGGVFQAERDYGALVEAAVPMVRRQGILFAACNAGGLSASVFVERVGAAVRRAGRVVEREHFASQPPDFPSNRQQPAHLKAVWMRVGG